MRARRLLLALVFAASPAQAVTRAAIIIGANRGDADEVELRYAEADARRMAETLRAVGGFAAEDLVLLPGTDPASVRQALMKTNARLRDDAGPALLFVYFSGHADAQSLHLAGERLALDELKVLVSGSPASARVLVLDACRSGAVTQLKGGRPWAPFRLEAASPLGASGVAMLASSGANEASQESDALGASFFTHAFTSALLGAGDENHDGRVTLNEAFGYAADRTRALTSATLAGAQHPEYNFKLEGQGELVLSRPGDAAARWGTLALPAGNYLVHERSEDGRVAAEATVPDEGAVLVLPPGRYVVDRRERDALLRGEVELKASQVSHLEPRAMRRFEYARLVRKGGRTRPVWSVVLEGGGRTPVLGLGWSPGPTLGVRLDLSFLSLELRAGLTWASTRSSRLRIDTAEQTLVLAATRVFDLGPLSLAAGWELGGFRWEQRFGEPQTPDRVAAGLMLGPIATLEWPVTAGVALRLTVAAESQLLETRDRQATASFVTPLSLRASLGASWGF